MSAANTEQLPGVEFVISREFNAPREKVYKAWSERDALAQWWGAKGSGIRIIAFEFRPGGSFHYHMLMPAMAQMPAGLDVWGKFQYEDMQAPERIVFINGFADAEGNAVRNPFAAAWPLSVRNVLTLTDNNGKTRLEMRAVPHDANMAEQTMFKVAHPAMQAGFGGTFEQLDAYLMRVA